MNNYAYRRLSRRALCGLTVIFFGLAGLPCARAQVFQFDIGSSSLFRATGASMRVLTPGSEANIGLGSLDGNLTSGGFYRRDWENMTFTLGDEVNLFQLPTDLFDSSHYFFARGASMSAHADGNSIFAFVGVTSTGVIVPFFRSGTFGQGAGALFLDHRLSRTLHLVSRNIVSSRQTSITGLEWKPASSIKLDSAAGVGANRGFVAIGGSVETEILSLKAGYADVGKNFQRILVSAPLTSENTGANVLLKLRPRRYFDLTAARLSLVQPATLSTPQIEAVLNQYSATFRFAKASLSASLFKSETQSIGTSGLALSASRNITGRIQASANLYRSRESRLPAATALVAMLRETVSSRLSLTEVANHSNGSTNFSWGGELTSNLITVGVDYQTVYSPFFPRSPFRQVLLLNLHFQPTHLLQINGSTFVGVDGSVKYTTYGSLYGYRDTSDYAEPIFKFPRYIVRGRVVDQSGEPIRGAAVGIGDNLLFSDRNGEFFVREQNRHPVHVEVKLREFAAPGVFAVRSCPATAIPFSQQLPHSILIVLERRSNSVPSRAGPGTLDAP